MIPQSIDLPTVQIVAPRPVRVLGRVLSPLAQKVSEYRTCHQTSRQSSVGLSKMRAINSISLFAPVQRGQLNNFGAAPMKL